MFHTTLRAKPPILSQEEINIGLEKCFKDLELASSTLERLNLAREVFVQIPDEQISKSLVNLFTSSFVDVPQHFVSETATRALEGAYRSSGKEMRAFALESGDGVIAKIVAFIRSLIDKIRSFFKAIFGRSQRSAKEVVADAVEHRKESTKKHQETTSVSSNQKQLEHSPSKPQPSPHSPPSPVEKSSDFSIKPTEDFLSLMKDGKLDESTVVSSSNALKIVAEHVYMVCKDLEGYHRGSFLDVETLTGMFNDKMGDDNEIILIPEGVWPAGVTIFITPNLQASIRETPVEKPELPELLVFKNMANFSRFGENNQKAAEAFLSSIKVLDTIMSDINKDIDKIKSPDQKDRSGNDSSQVLSITKLLAVIGKGISSYSMKCQNRNYKALEAIARKMESE